MPSNVKLEVPIFHPDAASTALRLGARRIELNATGSYSKGGLTPTIDELAQTMNAVNQYNPNATVRVMIRPREAPDAGDGANPEDGDFLYDHAEIVKMKDQIKDFVDSGLLREDKGDGFVFGVLLVEEETGSHAAGTDINVNACKLLVAAAQGYKCVLHRAVDDVLPDTQWPNPLPTPSNGHGEVNVNRFDWMVLEKASEAGFHEVLTSGGPGDAVDHYSRLHKLVKYADRPVSQDGVIIENQHGEPLGIIVGGGVRQHSAEFLKVEVFGRENEGASMHMQRWIHSSCLSSGSDTMVNEAEVQGILRRLA